MTDTQSPQASSPPLWLKHGAKWFRVGISLFVLISMLMGLWGCTSIAATSPWQPATSILPSAMLTQIVQQQTELPDPARATELMRGWTIPAKHGQVAVFDFNTSGLCGTKGCLYVAYWLQKEAAPVELLSTYLYPTLPNGQFLFEPGERKEEIPCLEVWQPADKTTRRRTTYCYNGQRYQVTASELYGSIKP